MVNKPREITPAEVEDVRARALAGESPGMIGRALGRSPARIEALLAVLGITPTMRGRGRPRKERPPKEPKPRGRPRVYSDDELAALRKRVEAGESYATLGRELGLSRQWVFRLLRPANPTGEPVKYWCKTGRHHFESRARYGPERCAKCGSMEWREGAGDAA